MSRTAFLSHGSCVLHEMGVRHPECPERLRVIEEHVRSAGLWEGLQHVQAQAATRGNLVRVHAPHYVDDIFRAAPGRGLNYLDADTAMNPHTLEAALHAAGAAVQAVDMVLSGEASNAFCSIRPPGHHAGHASAAGFCIFNNVAVAAAHALEIHGLQRVAIADFDVHHGNGTEDIFHDDPRVMLCSTFRHPYYPYCGANSGNEHIINVPLPVGTAGTTFRKAVTSLWLPALQRFQPQLLLISAGFDAHCEDEMGGFALVDDDYTWVSLQLREVAEQYCQGRIVSLLEGGYALNALGRSVVAHLRVLLQDAGEET